MWSAAAVVAALVVVPPAAAKEPISATVCGASGCKTFTDPATLNEIPSGEATVGLGSASPFYRVTIVAGEPGGATHSFSMYYLPSENAMAWGEDDVVRLHPIFGETATTLMRELTEGIEPFQPPRVTAALVDGRRVTGDAAQSYLSLFRLGGEPVVTSPSDWLEIDLRSARGSPWTDGRPDLVYSPSENLLERGWLRYEVSAGLADDIEAGRALDAEVGRSRRWALALAGIGALSLALLVGGLSLRSR